MKTYLRTLILSFITVIARISDKIRPCDKYEYGSEIYQVFNDCSVKPLKFTSTLNYNGSF